MDFTRRQLEIIEAGLMLVKAWEEDVAITYHMDKDDCDKIIEFERDGMFTEEEIEQIIFLVRAESATLKEEKDEKVQSSDS